MLNLMRTMWHALLYDEQAARRWLAGVGGVLTGAGASVAADIVKVGADNVLMFTKQQLLGHFIVGIAAGVLTMVSPTKPKVDAP